MTALVLWPLHLRHTLSREINSVYELLMVQLREVKIGISRDFLPIQTPGGGGTTRRIRAIASRTCRGIEILKERCTLYSFIYFHFSDILAIVI